jgi:hypothetical protein
MLCLILMSVLGLTLGCAGPADRLNLSHHSQKLTRSVVPMPPNRPNNRAPQHHQSFPPPFRPMERSQKIQKRRYAMRKHKRSDASLSTHGKLDLILNFHT